MMDQEELGHYFSTGRADSDIRDNDYSSVSSIFGDHVVSKLRSYVYRTEGFGR
jgi:hypothetical protein